MLRIHEIESADAAKRYHRESLSKGDYYQDSEEKGMWHGELAKELNLIGETTKQDFDNMVDNINPQTGETLTQRQSENRRPGYDFTFSCPKNVSIALSVGGYEDVREAFHDAVKSTMKDIEQEIKTRVRVKGADHERTTSNMAYAMFTHTTSREVDLEELVHAKNLGPDGLSQKQLDYMAKSLGIDKGNFRESGNHLLALPHLHAHCVVMNCTRDAEENKIKALTVVDIKRDAVFFQGLFHNKLAAELQKRGYGIEHGPNGFDLAGIRLDCAKKYSLRTQEIERIASELGITNQTQKSDLGAKTRKAKSKHLDAKKLKAKWVRMMTEAEQDELKQLKTHGNVKPEISPQQALNRSIQHCFERESVTPYRKVIGTALELGAGSFGLNELQNLPRPDLIQKEISGQMLCTTEAILNEERELLSLARNGKGKSHPLSLGPISFKYDFLNDGQKNAVHHVLSSPDKIVSIAGAPGSGKTTLLKEIKHQTEMSGKELFSFAPSSAAAEVMQKDEFEEANTVQYFIKNKTLHPSIQNQVVLIDEAGMLSIKDLLSVLKIAKSFDAKVVLSGDTKQHSSPNRGQALRLLEATKVVSSYRISKIMRQSNEYLEAVKAINDGRFETGLKVLDDLKWVHEVKGKNIYEKVVDAYLNGSKKEPPLIIAPTRVEGAKITSHLRMKLMENGRLSNKQKSFDKLVNLQWSDQQKQKPSSYAVGQVVKFYQNTKGVYRGQRLTISEVSHDGIKAANVAGQTITLPLDKTDRFTVFEKKTFSLAKGDLVRITDNGKSKLGGRLLNGKIYSVKGFKASGDIVLNNNWVVGKDFMHLEHGFVSTSHGSQGRTEKHTITLMNENAKGAINRAQTLVSLSRAKFKSEIFTDDKEALLQWAKKSSVQMTATELVGGDLIQRIQRGQIPTSHASVGVIRRRPNEKQKPTKTLKTLRRNFNDYSR